MSGVNKCILLGNLAMDPETRYTASGTPVTNFRMATNEVWNDKAGKRQERPEFHRVVAFGKLAELAGKYLKKGRQVYVEGKIQTRSWDDKEGNKRYTTEIAASVINFLGRADKNEDEPTKDEVAAVLDTTNPA